MLGLSRANRLTCGRDFQEIFKQSHKVARQYFLGLFKPNQQVSAKLGLVIAKRRVKRAVDRNKIKRILRESFRHHQSELQGFDVVIMMRSSCTTFDSKTWREDIEHLWEAFQRSLKKV